MNSETFRSDGSSTTKSVLVTGAAGFVGYFVAQALLEQGISVIGVDNLNDYYPVALKQARLSRLSSHAGFKFHRHDIADHASLIALPGVKDVDVVIHLAAQAGVRYSLENPFVYAASNLVGHLSILELVRQAAKQPLLVYELERDFTYIDDVVSGVVATALQPMKLVNDVPHRIYNIGNNTPVQLMRFIEVLEQAIGKKAQLQFEPMQPGDVHSTYADVSAIAADYGFAPFTPLETGIPIFIDWFRTYLENQANS